MKGKTRKKENEKEIDGEKKGSDMLRVSLKEMSIREKDMVHDRQKEGRTLLTEM